MGTLASALQPVASALSDGPRIFADANLPAGLVAEVSIHLVPVLFGSGTPLFSEGWLDQHVRLSPPEVVATDAATHLRYRVVK